MLAFQQYITGIHAQVADLRRQLMQAVQVSEHAPKCRLLPLHWTHVMQMLVYNVAVSADSDQHDTQLTSEMVKQH